MIRRRTLFAAGAALTTLAVAGCSGDDSGTGTGSGAGANTTLTLGSIVQCSSFAAKDARWANESFYMQAVYDTLLRANPDGSVAAGLATKWEWSADKMTLTLTLRDDVKFTDGTAFNAEAAAQNLIRFRDGASPNKSLLRSVADAKASDAKTVAITMKQPDPALLIALTQNAGLQESPAAFTASDLQTKPVGSGPYVLDTAKTVVGTEYYFTKNAAYWDAANRHFDNLVIKVYNDPTALLNAAKSGQINGSNTINLTTLKEYEASGWTLTSHELNWLGLLLLDRDGKMNPAMKDVRVRQAINYAFDTESLLKAYGNGQGKVTRQIFPPSSKAFDSALDSYYKYDPAKAKSLLAEAGFGSGLSLKMPQAALLGATVFTLLGQQLKDVGINVEFTQTSDYIPDMLAPKYPAAFMILQQDPDWALVNFQIGPAATFNPFKCSDDKINGFMDKMVKGTDAEAAQAAKDLNKYIVEQAWFAPWYRPSSVFVSDSTLSVTAQTGNAIPYLWNIKPKK